MAKTKTEDKSVAQPSEKQQKEEMVRMFKDDFDEMQREAARMEEELALKTTQAESEKARADEMLLQCQRIQAEFDNYRRRTNETNKKVRQDGEVEVLEKILPVLDAIEQAKKMITDAGTLSGIEIISRQLSELLTSFGVEMIEAEGLTFDPKYHNAIMEEESEDKKGIVTKVFQQGYRIGERVLRYSVVIVGK